MWPASPGDLTRCPLLAAAERWCASSIPGPRLDVGAARTGTKAPAMRRNGHAEQIRRRCATNWLFRNLLITRLGDWLASRSFGPGGALERVNMAQPSHQLVPTPETLVHQPSPNARCARGYGWQAASRLPSCEGCPPKRAGAATRRLREGGLPSALVGFRRLFIAGLPEELQQITRLWLARTAIQ